MKKHSEAEANDLIVKWRKSIICEYRLAKTVHLRAIKMNRMLKINKKNLVVAILAWLFMNTDPSYPQRVIGSMIASRMMQNSLSRSPLNFARGGRSNAGMQNGLNTVEAIALIHALNSNRGGGGGGGGDAINQLVDVNQLMRSSKGGTRSTSGRGSRGDILANPQLRQLETRQGPVPNPLTAVPTALAAVVAAAAAFLAAVAAGLTPLAALAAAVAAAAAALLAALLALVALVPQPNALIRNLIIRRTVLPFVIPIPIPIKKKEKEIIYIPKAVHYKEHHHHVEHKYKHKHKKSDDLSDPSYVPSAPPTPNRPDITQMDKVHSVLSEQARIQSIVDDLVDGTSARMINAASTPSITSARRSEHN